MAISSTGPQRMNLTNVQRWSLKTKMTLFTLAIFLVSIWSLVFYASGVLRTDIERLLGEQQFSAVSLLAGQVNLELDERLRALEIIAGKISPAMLANPGALQPLLENQLLQSLFNGGTYATGIDGTAIADVPLSAGRVGVNYIEVDHIAAALKEGKSIIGRPVMGKMLKAPVLPIGAPIRDAQGQIIGALSGVTTLSKPNFLDKITENRYGKTGGYVLMIPQYRLIITATDKSRIMQSLPTLGINPPLDRFLQGYEGSTVYINPLGVEVLGSAKKLPVSNWLMGVMLPTAEAFAPIRAMQQRLLLAAIFLTLLVGGIIWWMLRRLLLPMVVAVKTLTTLSDTNLPPQPLPITSQDEIGELIDGFNRLLGTLAQREKTLLEVGEQHRTIIQTAMDGFWMVDTNGRLLEVNESYCRMSGYSEQELLAMRIPDLETPVTAADIAARIQMNIAQGGYRFESCHRRKNGSIFNVEISVQYRLEGGRFVVFLRDITERKLVETALQESEERLRAIMDTASTVIFLKDTAGRYMHVNRYFEKLFHVSKAEIIGKTDYDIFPGDMADAFVRNDQIIIQSGQPLEIEERVPHDDGIHTYISVKFPLRNISGEIYAICGIATDITELKQAELYREMGREILQILSSPGELHDAIQRILLVLKTRTGFDAVGIRLQEGNDFPYFVQEGFSKVFLSTENSLIERTADGVRERDKDGQFKLECLCGLVISGQTDPTNPLFTPAGSFWTNDSYQLLDLPLDANPRYEPRNQCIHHGYASIALVPIGNNDKNKNIGLIQFNDHRKGRLSRETVEILEGIASHVGSALMRKQAEEALQKAHDELERRVQERTADVLSTNERLNQEIEERMRREEILEAHLLVREFATQHSLEDFLQKALNETERLTFSSIGFFHFLEEDQQTLSLQTWSTSTLETFCKAEGKGLHYNIDKAGVWVDCIRQRQPVIHNDYAGLSHCKGLPPGHAAVIRELVVPIMRGDRIMAILGVGNKEQDYDSRDTQTVVEMANMVWDIVLRKQAEQRLFDSKATLITVFDGISDPLIMMDQDLRIKRLNLAARDYYGLSTYNEILGHYCFETFQNRLTPCEGCERPFSTMRGFSGSFERRGERNPDRLERVFVDMVKDEAGAPKAYIARIADITQARMMDRQLIQSEKLASLGLLIAGIAHEINNPNNFIYFNAPILRSYLQFLLPFVDEYAVTHPELQVFNRPYSVFREDCFKLLNNIEYGSSRINQIVGNLREFVRERGQGERHPVDLKVVMDKALSICRGRLEKMVKTIDMDIPEGLPTVLTDPLALEQVVVNLLINAAQATDKDNSWIHLSIRLHTAPECEAIIEVSDNGCGMDNETKRNIFDPFFTTKAVGVGTGLGLSISHRLMVELGGCIEVESERGKGSMFRLVLPLNPA